MTPHCLAEDLADPQLIAAKLQLRITQLFGQATRCHAPKAKHEHLRMRRHIVLICYAPHMPTCAPKYVNQVTKVASCAQSPIQYLLQCSPMCCLEQIAQQIGVTYLG